MPFTAASGVIHRAPLHTGVGAHTLSPYSEFTCEHGAKARGEMRMAILGPSGLCCVVSSFRTLYLQKNAFCSSIPSRLR